MDYLLGYTMEYIACYIMEYIDTMFFLAVEWGDRCSFSLKNGYKLQTQGGIMARYCLLRML